MFQIDQVTHTDYLEYALSGAPTSEDWLAFIERIEVESKQFNQQRVLVDVRGCDATPEPMLRYKLGVSMGKTFSAGIRIAVQELSQNIDYFWETVAVNRGVQAKVASKREVLLEWLRQDD